MFDWSCQKRLQKPLQKPGVTVRQVPPFVRHLHLLQHHQLAVAPGLHSQQLLELL